MLSQFIFSLAAPGGANAKLSTLIFHRVLASPDPLLMGEVDADRFDSICTWIKRWFNVLPLGKAIHQLYAGELPPRALAISFDDGYADNSTVAAPLLSKHGLPATVFVASGCLNGGCMWNDGLIDVVRRTGKKELDLRGLDLGLDGLAVQTMGERREAIDTLIRALKYRDPDVRQCTVGQVALRAQVTPRTDLMMTTAQLQQLAAHGVEVGAHTVSHPILARLSRSQARAEIETGRSQLQSLLGRRVPLFAYPNGKPHVDYNKSTVELVKEAGFEAALTTAWGVSTPLSDRFQLARFTPWDRSQLRFGARLARNCYSVASSRVDPP
jgi:peptidoglycan/xylan/chitin deacetylase (PgdA/CDA1 family)